MVQAAFMSHLQVDSCCLDQIMQTFTGRRTVYSFLQDELRRHLSLSDSCCCGHALPSSALPSWLGERQSSRRAVCTGAKRYKCKSQHFLCQQVIPVHAFRLEPITRGGLLVVDGELIDDAPVQVAMTSYAATLCGRPTDCDISRL